MLQDIPGNVAYLDDIIIMGTDYADLEKKVDIVSDYVLRNAHNDPDLPIVVTTYASNYGIGAAISHTYPDGSEKTITHAARSLTTTEKNHSQIRK
ncbi:unnamed protein product [Schistosoma margrebowiei]|uniref:Uncharacterized protein n=1 Tax=Schistosoma margrebowiei TaxID=48269 RepID=A0A183N1I3_9TREM|nr:unnamed protein product [Schistosoma margrebowiei]